MGENNDRKRVKVRVLNPLSLGLALFALSLISWVTKDPSEGVWFIRIWTSALSICLLAAVVNNYYKTARSPKEVKAITLFREPADLGGRWNSFVGIIQKLALPTVIAMFPVVYALGWLSSLSVTEGWGRWLLWVVGIVWFLVVIVAAGIDYGDFIGDIRWRVEGRRIRSKMRQLYNHLPFGDRKKTRRR